jgi:hypothetical protein
VEAQQHLPALGEAGPRPRRLRLAGARDRGPHVVGRAARHGAKLPAGERLLHVHPLAGAVRADARGERLQERWRDAS